MIDGSSRATIGAGQNGRSLICTDMETYLRWPDTF